MTDSPLHHPESLDQSESTHSSTPGGELFFTVHLDTSSTWGVFFDIAPLPADFICGMLEDDVTGAPTDVSLDALDDDAYGEGSVDVPLFYSSITYASTPPTSHTPLPSPISPTTPPPSPHLEDPNAGSFSPSEFDEASPHYLLCVDGIDLSTLETYDSMDDELYDSEQCGCRWYL